MVGVGVGTWLAAGAGLAAGAEARGMGMAGVGAGPVAGVDALLSVLFNRLYRYKETRFFTQQCFDNRVEFRTYNDYLEPF